MKGRDREKGVHDKEKMEGLRDGREGRIEEWKERRNLVKS